MSDAVARRALAVARRLLDNHRAQRDLTRQGALVQVSVLEPQELADITAELALIEMELNP